MSVWISADVAPPQDEELFLVVMDKVDSRKWVCVGEYKGSGEWHDLFIGRFDPCRYRITHWQLLAYPEVPE